MDFNIYREFREKLLGISLVNENSAAGLSQLIKPLADALCIGHIEYSIHAPSATGTNGVVSLFSEECSEQSCPFVESFNTSDGGIASFKVTPKGKPNFSVDEIQGIKMLLWDIFMLAGTARLEALLQKASVTDSLTDAENQAGLTRFIGKITAQGRIKEYASIFINLKNFKYVNKSIGSQAGDLGLKVYVSSAKVFLAADEMIARMGGDNFVVILKKDNVDAFVSKFTNLPVSLSMGPKPVSFTIQSRMGVFFASEKDSISDLMNNSAIALSVARNIRTTDVVRFTKEMLINAMHQREISSEFRKSLSNNEFAVYYQPKVNLSKKQLCGAEALVRWIRHKTVVPPVDFVPILEKEGSICALDFFVFETVCRDIQSWLENNIEPVRISVNFSKLHLRDEGLAHRILDIMRKYNVESKYIEIELTEVSDYDDCEAMRRFVTEMRSNDISVSIDDFGTGYSTLNVLKNFDVSVIKLDKSLLDNIGNKESFDEVVVKNVVNLAQEMNKEVIAEGVESEVQANFLSEINCHSVQGFLFDKPLKHDDFESRLTGAVAY
ncbi:MAG: GGDEF domain-containing phosphodiesterase [Fibrobacter sp.]|nr:GGDEF domain-containing phosphodiesterase [Fibrobacter sp.]